MSGLVGNTVSTMLGLDGVTGNSDVLQPADYRVSPPRTEIASRERRYSDFLWKRSIGLGAANMGEPGLGWEWGYSNPTGGHVNKKVSGVVVDEVGVPISGVTVTLYNKVTGLLVDTQTTDASGNYYVSDPNSVVCFAVAYLTGSPDKTGVTLNTVTGT